MFMLFSLKYLSAPFFFYCSFWYVILKYLANKVLKENNKKSI